MPKAVVFAGTTEGRQISNHLAKSGVDVSMCVATEYGRKIAGETNHVFVHTGNMNAQEMREFIKPCSYVVDATHPYAYEATKNIKQACDEEKKPYYRLLRPPGNTAGCLVMENAEQVAKFLKDKEGNVLLTTGSKDLMAYRDLDVSRLYPRVLPTHESLKLCEGLCVPQENIICMHGPFSVSMNRALLKSTASKFLVTKDSGVAGGYQEKLEAAQKEKVTVIVIGRASKEEGYTMQRLKSVLMDRYGE